MIQGDEPNQPEDACGDLRSAFGGSDTVAREDSEKEELRAFVGKMSGYYLRKWRPVLTGSDPSAGFNWAAFLLVGFWLPYRKMYKIALMFYGFILLESLGEELVDAGVLGEPIGPSGFGSLIALLAGVFCGALGNGWYLSHARKRIARLRSEAVEREVLLQRISSRGGTSLGSSLGFFLSFLVIAAVAYAVLDLVQPPP